MEVGVQRAWPFAHRGGNFLHGCMRIPNADRHDSLNAIWKLAEDLCSGRNVLRRWRFSCEICEGDAHVRVLPNTNVPPVRTLQKTCDPATEVSTEAHVKKRAKKPTARIPMVEGFK